MPDRCLWVWFSRVWTEWRTALVIVEPVVQQVDRSHRHCTTWAWMLGLDEGRSLALIPCGYVVPLWHPFRLLLVALAGWINQQQRDVIDYLQEENRILREQLGPRRLRFTNDHVYSVLPGSVVTRPARLGPCPNILASLSAS